MGRGDLIIGGLEREGEGQALFWRGELTVEDLRVLLLGVWEDNGDDEEDDEDEEDEEGEKEGFCWIGEVGWGLTGVEGEGGEEGLGGLLLEMYFEGLLSNGESNTSDPAIVTSHNKSKKKKKNYKKVMLIKRILPWMELISL